MKQFSEEPDPEIETLDEAFSPDIELTERGQTVYKQMNTVYKFLGHHYVLKRSVLFIMDYKFDSMA